MRSWNNEGGKVPMKPWLRMLMFGFFLPMTVLATPYFPKLSGAAVHDIPLGPNVTNPGILLIIVDSLRPDHLGAYGYARPTSPFIDSLATNGVLFANHFSNSTWTKTSISSLFTGLYPQRHKVLPVTSKLAPDISTMAEMFKKAGFRTGAVICNQFGGRGYGLDRGFERYADPGSRFGGRTCEAGEALKLALRWIDEDKKHPFFYTIFLMDPHTPYTPPASYRQEFCSSCASSLITSPLREYIGRGPSPKQIQDMQGLYDGEIRYMDDQLKTFYSSLKTLGVLERLSTIVMADHGEAFGEHREYEHAFHIRDEVVRTPLIINSPRITARGIYHGLSQHVDILPTLLKLGGVSRPGGLQGIPLVRDAGDPLTTPATRVAVTEVQMYGIHRTVIRDHQLKLIVHEPVDEVEFARYYQDFRIYPSIALGKEKRELYNVQTDPGEQLDLYPTRRELAANLESKLKRYQETGEVNDPDSSSPPTEDVLKDLKSLGYIQ